MRLPAPVPMLLGLRLGFADLGAAAEALEAVLQLPSIRVDPPAAPGAAPRRHYALAGLRVEARVQASSPVSGGPRPALADTVQWHQDAQDLGPRRHHLQRLGLSPLAGVDFGCGSYLRLETLDTGACAVEWHAAPEARAPLPPTPQAALLAIDLRVRAPERVAGHWAQLLDLPLARDAGGVPLLRTAPAALRFVPAADAAGSGIDALVFTKAQAEALAGRAAARGLQVTDDASWALEGLQVRGAAAAF
ncbi:hypothetical protein [Xenophilus sp. Marseille-Q4582]|uniref:hypothetical protein n=1 Tax=Xenophilus sp. Marseille-Q4582 TaxID=2866600 RepID=UPI001CE3F93B|nr:hypothetical protein [Xenophilus sp. Marseille-Q4582]